jgi:hypothetical protein
MHALKACAQSSRDAEEIMHNYAQYQPAGCCQTTAHTDMPMPFSTVLAHGTSNWHLTERCSCQNSVKLTMAAQQRSTHPCQLRALQPRQCPQVRALAACCWQQRRQRLLPQSEGAAAAAAARRQRRKHHQLVHAHILEARDVAWPVLYCMRCLNACMGCRILHAHIS